MKILGDGDPDEDIQLALNRLDNPGKRWNLSELEQETDKGF
ncbi:MAG: hypothetical protein U1B30_09635 [Pseudomonadota bacterium]|nr:hypothetical protein [Pseudomonadota bacterium]